MPPLDQHLRAIELRCRQPVQHLLAGEYRSIFKGRGIEYEDVREYTPGDDTRSIDWRVTARTGTPYIKRFIEEREQVFYLIVDLSASIIGPDGKSPKRDKIVELGALLALSAIANNDQVACILFTDQVEEVIPPGKSRTHALRIIDALQNWQARNRQTQLTTALRSFANLARKSSVAFCISDFYDSHYLSELSSLNYRHDIVAVTIESSFEQHPPNKGLWQLNDIESGQQALYDLSQQKPSVPRATLRQQLQQHNIDLISLDTQSDCILALKQFFQQRRRQHSDNTGG